MATPHLDTLNGLLRGELAATETYQQALRKVDSEHGALQLAQIRDEHSEAVSLLRKQIREFGGDPETSSGSWGTFAKAIESTAQLFGNGPALTALKQGEETGLSTYESAVQSHELPALTQSLINGVLLPQTRAHIATLERLQSLQHAS
ncbi:hypothetical protein ETAA8_56270 [Anatilimnocola aggregata]|uniref:DUF2383 domain-containing protein n=1 Tax=Anatilimnocola aggregata TaxID=2528021 RepID=A0A517YJV3_9BACT|nr:DUF2383 domain-containing protein [Anatilimnocola aggregata]QDU30487.1 hypothetical protein ETAA8_56270 [Anatilimnocola aggregata]